MCNDDDGERYDSGVLVRDEVVVKQKPGYVVVQVAEETLRAIQRVRKADAEVEVPDAIVNNQQALDACEAIDNLAAASQEAWELIFRDLGDALEARGE